MTSFALGVTLEAEEVPYAIIKQLWLQITYFVLGRNDCCKDKKEFLIGPFHYTFVHFTDQVPIELEAIFYLTIKVSALLIFCFGLFWIGWTLQL
jgi:hypothetical protein